ncbi:MAG: phosphoglycerate kinase [Bacteriovoracaceae bacterium]|nr:phosphoglycerate kinase [Bacteriovoracaceae bacterium]
MALKFIDQAEFKGKRVLARFDFNVPLDKEDRSKISDTSRIDLAIPTIKHFIENGASKITLMSHLGRPKGKKDEKYSLEPVATYLAEQLGTDVVLADAPVDAGVKELLTLNETKIVLLENLRFDPGEESDEEEFAFKLSQYGDIYVNDAFGAAHRKHASVYGINKFYKNNAYGGLLIKKELEALNKVLETPARPFVAIIGGAKVSDKIKTIEKLLISVNHLIIGGAMAYPFLKAKGHGVGKSLCSDEDVKLAASILKADKGNKVVLPEDHVVAQDINGESKVINSRGIDDDWMALDIGPSTINRYENVLKDAKTVLWNGPMGLFENPKYAKGTMALAKALSTSNAFTLVGGGDSVSAVQKSGHADKFSHISTGGGASLEYIEKGQLPGIQALKYGV